MIRSKLLTGAAVAASLAAGCAFTTQSASAQVFYGPGAGSWGPYAYSDYYAPGPLALGADLLGGAIDLGLTAATAPLWGTGWGYPDYGYYPAYGYPAYGYPAYGYGYPGYSVGYGPGTAFYGEYNGRLPVAHGGRYTQRVAYERGQRMGYAHHGYMMNRGHMMHQGYMTHHGYRVAYAHRHGMANVIKKNTVAHKVRQAHHY